MIDGALTIARETRADAIMLAAALPVERQYLTAHAGGSLRVLTAGTPPLESAERDDAEIVALPQVRLRRRGRAKDALLEAIASGALNPGESVVIISGNVQDDTTHLDTVALV